MIVKPRQHNVVLVEDMHPIPTSPLNASIPGICQALVLGFGVERHPARANSANNFGSGIIHRAVVNYLDLHLIRAGVLLENAVQRFLQVIRSRVERRNHHRPERPRTRTVSV